MYVLSCLAVSNSVAQAPLSMEFSRQLYWSRVPFPTPGDLPNLRTEPESLASPALAGGFFTTTATGKPFFRQETALTDLPPDTASNASPTASHESPQGTVKTK